jgi:hypothetical protein
VRAPSLERTTTPQWGEPVSLFNGRSLTGWKVRSVKRPYGWKVEKGLLVNRPPSTDIFTEQQFEDFKLHVEFKVPKEGNSGIYLRGRYEVQIYDDYGTAANLQGMAAINGFVVPTSTASKKAGEWQSYHITLVGRHLTVVLNGVTVIENQEIPGITGGALDSHEGAPGPIMIQGDHGAISIRKMILTPAKKPGRVE